MKNRNCVVVPEEYSFGGVLRFYRESKGLSQDNLAAAMGDGCDKRQISGWERGKHEPRVSRFFAIVQVLERDPGDFAPPGMFEDTPGQQVLRLFNGLTYIEQDFVITMLKSYYLSANAR